MLYYTLGIWILAATTAMTGASPRQTASLNGDWQYQNVENITTPPTAGKWTEITVPGTIRGTNYERVWFRRSFMVPEKMRGSRVKIEFDGVKYDSHVYVNGKKVGGCKGGYDPFVVDVTDVVCFDGPNELAVGCHDWTATFSPGEVVDFSSKPDWQRPRRFVKNRVIAPIGGLYDSYGIWGDVRLTTQPAVYIKDLFIKTSVRRGELVVDYTVANESNKDVEVELQPTVEENGKDVFKLKPMWLLVPAGKQATATVQRAWSKPRLWSHIDPHLYHIRSQLSTGDVLSTRFGFREFWVDGHAFYLNGIKINMLATSWWPGRSDRMTREEIKRCWELTKKCGCAAFRTHTQPWRRIHYDVADEVGLLMIVEGAMWHDPHLYRYDEPVYWNNFARHLQSMVGRDKNHPSVVMWSVENEAYCGVKQKDTDAHDGLARMGRLMKKWDPTRLVYCESDADPGNVYDAIGCHYPHEYPQYYCWPNEAYWLEKGTKVCNGYGRREFTWEKNKPLYIGEFLWVPTGTPEGHTPFFGDEMYTDPRHLALAAKAESWKMQIIGYRHAEVAGISPWTLNGNFDADNPLLQAHQYAYQHLAAFCHNYDSRFYSGEKVSRDVEVFNDVMEPSELLLEWTLILGEKVVDQGSRQLSLGPAEKEAVDVRLRMPDVAKRTPITWRLTLKRDGKQVFGESREYLYSDNYLFPKTTITSFIE